MKLAVIAALIAIASPSADAFAPVGCMARINAFDFQDKYSATALKSTPELDEMVNYATLAHEGGSRKTPAELRARLEKASMNIRNASLNGSFMVSQAAIDKVDPEILQLLEENNGLVRYVPRTWAGLIKGYLTNGGGAFVVVSMLLTFFFRLFLSPSLPLGGGDLIAIVATRLFWEVQEWLVHSRWFHGSGNFRAHSLFKNHDVHHDLPYYHLAVESRPLVIVWWSAVASLLVLACGCGVTPSILTTAFFAYQASAFVYSFTHAAAHSMIPFKEGSYFKKAKVNHVKHHILPSKYLNLGPNNVDKLMGTDSYDGRDKLMGTDSYDGRLKKA